jgi:hypothetical protein
LRAGVGEALAEPWRPLWLVGYIGLQAHGGPNDVVSFRHVRNQDLT